MKHHHSMIAWRLIKWEGMEKVVGMKLAVTVVGSLRSCMLAGLSVKLAGR